MNLGKTISQLQNQLPAFADGLEAALLVLPENELAATAITMLAGPPLKAAPSLVFLHGPSGVGKTHLARHCLRLQAHEKNAGSVLCKSAPEFIDEFTEAAQLRSVRRFQLEFDDIDFLVVEDFHALENRSESQQQLLARMDQIVCSGGKILITSRKSPGELTGIQQRLISRCLGGVCCAVRMPDPSSRRKLLTHFAGSLQIPITAKAIAGLAEALSVSPRELRSTLIQLEAAAALGRRQIDDDVVSRFLNQEILRTELEISDISRAVAREFDFSQKELRSRNQNHTLVLARQCAMFLTRELTEISLTVVGDYFGNRDHSTVVYACKRFKKLLPDHAEIRRQVSRIRQTLNVPDC